MIPGFGQQHDRHKLIKSAGLKESISRAYIVDNIDCIHMDDMRALQK